MGLLFCKIGWFQTTFIAIIHTPSYFFLSISHQKVTYNDNRTISTSTSSSASKLNAALSCSVMDVMTTCMKRFEMNDTHYSSLWMSNDLSLNSCQSVFMSYKYFCSRVQGHGCGSVAIQHGLYGEKVQQSQSLNMFILALNAYNTHHFRGSPTLALQLTV